MKLIHVNGRRKSWGDPRKETGADVSLLYGSNRCVDGSDVERLISRAFAGESFLQILCKRAECFFIDRKSPTDPHDVMTSDRRIHGVTTVLEIEYV